MKSLTAFSLMELFVVLIIITILAVVSIPLYSHHLVNAKRRQAEVALLHLASRLEEYRSTTGSYENASFKTLGIKNHLPSYELTLNELHENEYLITATPLGTQEQRDKMCGNLSLNEKGEQTASGLDPLSCWN